MPDFSAEGFNPDKLKIIIRIYILLPVVLQCMPEWSVNI